MNNIMETNPNFFEYEFPVSLGGQIVRIKIKIRRKSDGLYYLKASHTFRTKTETFLSSMDGAETLDMACYEIISKNIIFPVGDIISQQMRLGRLFGPQDARFEINKDFEDF